jgi:hypothetical protein
LNYFFFPLQNADQIQSEEGGARFSEVDKLVRKEARARVLLAALISLSQPWLPAVEGVCATRGMATAIDFQALMAEEKRKMLALHTGAAGEMAKTEPATSFLPTWQSQPDRAVNLASPRPPLVLEQVYSDKNICI